MGLVAAIWGAAATVLGKMATVLVVRQLADSLQAECLSGSHTVRHYLLSGTTALELVFNKGTGQG